MPEPTNPKTVPELRAIMTKFLDWLEKENEPEYTQSAADMLNDMLDYFYDDDCFGTEGQNDPRGDHR